MAASGNENNPIQSGIGCPKKHSKQVALGRNWREKDEGIVYSACNYSGICNRVKVDMKLNHFAEE